MDELSRKEFIKQAGGAAAALLLVSCGFGCKKKSTSQAPQGPDNINFTLDVSSGPLSANGGALIQDGVIVARNVSGNFYAIAAACTHQAGTNLLYSASNNNFICPNHGSQFATDGSVAQGPATAAEKKYNTSLSGHMLRVYS